MVAVIISSNQHIQLRMPMRVCVFGCVCAEEMPFTNIHSIIDIILTHICTHDKVNGGFKWITYVHLFIKLRWINSKLLCGKEEKKNNNNEESMSNVTKRKEENEKHNK